MYRVRRSPARWMGVNSTHFWRPAMHHDGWWSTVTPAIAVEVKRPSGNPVTIATNSITMAIGANPGSAMLGGTLTVNASGGIATFSDLTIDQVGT